MKNIGLNFFKIFEKIIVKIFNPILFIIILRTKANEFDLKNILSCCKYIQQESALFDCSIDVNNKIQSNQYVFVMYATQNIINYTSYSLAVNTAYMEKNNYKIVFTSPELGFEYDSYDQRWNKVRILYELLKSNISEYLIWLDSDLIVLDFDMRIEDIVTNNPTAYLIISRDADPDDIYSVANTGFIILKSSKKTLDFLKDWWSNEERYIYIYIYIYNTDISIYYIKNLKFNFYLTNIVE
jgi:hypothetical protein